MDNLVVCYGCRGKYDPTDEKESWRHTHHTTAPVLKGLMSVDREFLRGLLDECQRERDAALRQVEKERRRTDGVRQRSVARVEG